MASRRLNVPRSGEDAPKALPGVVTPVRGSGRACDLAHVLEIVFDHSGLNLGYDAIMGLSGLAFHTPHDPFPPRLDPAEAVTAIETLSAAVEPGLQLHRGEQSPDAIMEIVSVSVDQGRPCAALGWGSVKERWSVICGYDRRRERLLGHCVLEEPRERYESWPPTLELLVTLPAAPRARGREAIDRAITTAGEKMQNEGQDAWERWTEALFALDDTPPIGHMLAVELVADARTAAAVFLDAVADHYEPIPAAWLHSAAERCRALVGLLEAGGGPLHPETFVLLEDQMARDSWVESLRLAARIDEAIAADLRLSLKAEYPPDEAEEL